MISPRRLAPRVASPGVRCFVLLFSLLLIFTASIKAGDGDWKPIDPQQLQVRTPTVDPDADAEALFWEVRVDDATQDLVLSHYVRTKIFTERGRESQSKVELPFGKIYGRNIRLKDIEARTITPDGTIIPVKKDDIFERTEIKTNGLKWKVKSFAMPGVVPGAIIEYRWREVRENSSANYMRLEFQRDIPIQRVTYFVKPSGYFINPYTGAPLGMRFQPFRISEPKFTKEKNGFYSLTQTNVAAFREEPRMPPASSVRSWVLIYYSPDRKLSAQQFWRDHGQAVYEANKRAMQASDDVRSKAAEIIGDAATPEEKINRLLTFCRTQIKDFTSDTSGFSAEERLKMKENKTPSDTLRRGIGNSRDIDLLFAALATAVGLEARVAVLGDRSDSIFDPSFADDYFLRTYAIAVRSGSGANWNFVDPCNAYVKNGMLPWQMEGQTALVSDPKEPVFVRTQVSAPQQTAERRTATLILSEDGTVEGDVRIEYTGHLAAINKEQNDEETTADREAILRARIKEQMSAAEVTNVQVENAIDGMKPFVYSFHIRVPAYAQRTGKRLFLQPAFFQKDKPALFTTSTRTHPIFFDFGWAEEDAVTIELPKGFALDNAEAPQTISAGPLSKYEVHAAVTNDQRQLIYKRKFYFGNDQLLQFDTNAYTQLKRYFDAVHEGDKHTIALKAGSAAK